jgi:VanZ family protein
VTTTTAPAWRYLWLWQTLGWGLVTVVVALSLLPLPHSGIDLPQGDKWGHLIAYASLALCFAQWAGGVRERINQALGLIGLGALLEGLQSLTGYRQAEWLDFLANTVGVVLGALVALGPAGRVLRAIDARLAVRSSP